MIILEFLLLRYQIIKQGFMKNLLSLLIVCIFLFSIQIETKAQVHVNVINSWGHNTIDFEALMGVPYWDEGIPAMYTQITDYSRFVYKGGIQATYDASEKIRLGGELGINRLYYVEERYSVLLNDTEFRWRMYNIWTLNVGGLAQLFLTDNIYLQSGIGFHYFFYGPGIALGTMAGIGYKFQLSEKYSVPIEFRNDWVFGEATSGIFSLAVGFTINL